MNPIILEVQAKIRSLENQITELKNKISCYEDMVTKIEAAKGSIEEVSEKLNEAYNTFSNSYKGSHSDTLKRKIVSVITDTDEISTRLGIAMEGAEEKIKLLKNEHELKLSEKGQLISQLNSLQ